MNGEDISTSCFYCAQLFEAIKLKGKEKVFIAVDEDYSLLVSSLI